MRTPRLPRALLLLAVIGTGVSGFLPEPKLSVQTLNELGSAEMAVCEVSNQSESDSLLINMYLQNEKLSTTQTREGDKEIAQATLSFDQAGTYSVKCTASNELDSKTASSSIIVYNFPDPLLASEEDEDDGENIIITCSLPEVSPMVEIHITATRAILTCEEQRSTERSCSLTNQKENDGKTVTCKAVMSLPGNVLTTEKTIVLDIEYAPGFTDDGCPTNQILREGEVNVVLCNAVGKPTPEVSCSKDTLTYPKGILAEVTGNDSGKYTCRAKNKLDIVKKIITVSVQENPSKLTNGASSGTILSAMLVMVCHMI